MLNGFAYSDFNIGFTITKYNLILALGWIGFSVCWKEDPKIKIESAEW